MNNQNDRMQSEVPCRDGRRPYAAPQFYRHGSLEKITESLMLPNMRDANMTGCAQGA